MLAKVKNTKGFSLIELLVVIVIIGILSTGAVSYFGSARAKARDGVRTSVASQIGQTIMAYALEYNGYNDTNITAAKIQEVLESDFGNSVPADPAGDYRFIFVGEDSGLRYAVCFYSEVKLASGCVGDAEYVDTYSGEGTGKFFVIGQDGPPVVPAVNRFTAANATAGSPPTNVEIGGPTMRAFVIDSTGIGDAVTTVAVVEGA